MLILESGVGNYVRCGGRRYSYFGGNNYLGLADHPYVRAEVIRAVRKYGINFSASRRTTGTASIHLELEKQLSIFKGKEDTVVFASGYQGNGILLEVLKESYSMVFMDRLAHASIADALPGDKNVSLYDHNDAAHLETLIDRQAVSNPLVITDGIFPLTGEIAPLDKIFPVVRKHKGILVVDDAHATGILGKTGRGTPEHFGLPDDIPVYQTETMSKALGGYGGFISGTREFTGKVRERSTTYQSSTALPPPVVAAGIASLKIIHDNPGLRVGVLLNAGILREEIMRMGFQTTGDKTPIVPIFISSPERAGDLSLFLEKNGIIVPFMNYSAKEERHILRIAVTASHTPGQIDTLIRKLNKWIKKNGKD